MPDNTILNLGAGGDTIATEEIGGIKYELIKLMFGGNGVATKVDAANPLPVTDAVAEAALTSIAAEDFATQATLAALLAKVITAPSTEAKQDAMITLLTTIAAITQPLTDTQLRDTPVPISGTVAVTGGGDATAANQVTGNASLASIDGKLTNPLPVSGIFFQATQPVSGTFFQATQPVSAAVLPLPTGAAIAANQQTDALTDAQLRASAVPVIESAPTTVFNGKTTVTTAGTRVVLASTTPVKSVTIKAALANTGTIYVGNATVAAANGFELAPGDTISMDIANLNTVNIDSSINAQSVTYIGIN